MSDYIISHHDVLTHILLYLFEANEEPRLHAAVGGKIYLFTALQQMLLVEEAALSSSDRLTRWEELGVWGALLSPFTQPVYTCSTC